jgi:hypothetical protein
MPLVFKKSFRDRVDNITVLVDDKTSSSPNYFRVSDVPQILTKGKNLIKISGHPTNLKEDTQIFIDVRDSNGNPIYYEIPDYIEDDKSRVISIWVYHDKGDDNTPNGEATITLVGVANNDVDGLPVPASYKNKLNVRWQTKVNVDRDRSSTTPIIFNSNGITPSLILSESIESYQNQPQSGNDLDLTVQEGKVRYIFKGKTPIVQITDGTTFNQEMQDSSILLSNFTTPATPKSKEEPTNLNFFSGSIKRVTNTTTIQLNNPYTASFQNREGLKHTYDSVEESDYKIEYFRTSSNVSTENQRSFVNISFNNVDPIVGVVDKIKVLQKSDGLPGEFELLNEVAVPFSSSFSVKIPMPSENLQDPKLLKIQYLNSIGEISRTETNIGPFVFQGGNSYIGGSQNLISGSIFVSNTVGTGIELGGASSGFMRSVGFEGQTSASLGKAPGGFVIYSGSGNLQMGADTLEGVGMQFIGDNDERHLIFTTANGGLLDVKTDKFFIGTENSQFISGSDSNIEISSSLFHLDPKNNLLTIGADAVIKAGLSADRIFTPAIIDGAPSNINNASSSITQDGFAKFTSASIAGFTVNESEIKSADESLRLKADGNITASKVLLQGGTITDNVTILGSVSANSIQTPATIGGNPSTVGNASSSITDQGFASFKSASIGGWDITPNTIQGSNLVMRPAGILQTRDFASGVKGWKISSEGNGTAEFENIRIRGTLRTTTFEKESVNAVGGQLWVTNATTLTGSNITSTQTTMSVKNASGFAVGEILLAKKVDGTGFQTEYLLIESASIDGDNSGAEEVHGRIYVQRAYGSGQQGEFVGDLASSAQTYDEGQVIVSTGLSGSGYIKMNANPKDTATPYMDIVERTGSGLFDAQLKVRLGDLSGLANSDYVFGNPNPGFGLATDNVFLQGGIIANTGSIAGIKMTDGKLFTGNGSYGNSNTGFYVDSDSQFSLGNKLVWNPTTEALVIRGQLQLSDGSDVGSALAEATSSNTSKTVSLGASSYVITFNSLGNQDPAGQSITLTATEQNHVGTVYYEFRKGGSLQGARGTSNTFVADQSSEQPSATTPVTYEVKTFEVASGGSQIASDTLTLFGVQAGASGSDGTSGQDGVDAVTAFLTNEAHTFAANPDKSIVSLTGGSTDMIVFEGITDKTTSYSYSRSSSTSVSSSISSNTVTVTSMAHDSGSIIITATSASTSLSKTMSLSKAIAGQTGSDGTDGTDGLDGTSAKTLVASIDSQVMAFDDSSDTSATPTEVVFSFNQQNLNAAIGSSDITISTAGGNVTNFGFDNNSVTNSSGKHSGISSGSISFTGALNSGGLNSTKSNFPVAISITKDGLSDSIKLFKVEGGADGTAGADGTDAVTTFLTNESHTFTAESDGTIISFIGGSTDMEVFEGVTNSTANYTISSSRGLGVTATDSGKTVTISGMTHDSGSVTITATSASVSLSKSMSLTKSKQGTAGLAGSDAKILTVSSDSQVFSFPSASSSTAIDNDILITINQQNLSGTVGGGDFTIVDANGSTLSDPTLSASVTDGSGQVTGTITFSGTASGDKTKLPLTITVSKDSLEDSIKIFGIDGGNEGQDGAAGADAVTTFLTNESHTFPADSSGSIASFVGGSTNMEIFEGITNKTSLYTISSSVSLGVTATDNSNTVTIGGMNHDSGSVTITATSASVSLSKIMSLTKARQGSDGSDGTSAKLLIGSLDSQVFAFTDSTDTTSEPEKVFFSYQQQNLSAAIVAGDLTITTAGGSNITNFDFNNSDISSGTGIVSGSIVFSQALNNGGVAGTKSNLPITVSATKDGLQDSVRVFKVEGGSDGTDGESARTMILTNESHTFAAQPNGTIISFTGGDTDVEVFTGTSNTTSDYSISAASTTSVSSSVSSNTVTVTSMGHDSGSVVVTATSASVNLQKLFSLTKAKQGADGEDGASGDKFADTSISTTINLSTLNIDDTITFTADTGLAWTAGLTAVVAYDGSNSITGTVNSYNSSNGSMSINVDSIVGTSTQTAWTLNLGGTAGPQGVSGVSAKSLVASTDSQVFSFLSASDSTAEPTSIIFSFNQQNLNDSIGSSDVTITAGDGTNITGFGFDNNSVTDGTGIASGSISFSSGTSAGGLNSDKTKLPVTISVTNDSLTDSIKVFKVEGGTSGTDGTDGSDAVTTFLTNEAHTFASQNDGTIVSFSGAQTDMEVFEGVTNKTSVYTFSKSDGLGVTSSITGKTVTVSGMTHDSGSVTITAVSASTSLSKTMSLVKSKQGTAGLAGADAKLLTITSDSQVFAFPSASSSTPEDNDILLIINQQNLSGTIGGSDITIKDSGGNTLTDPTFVASVTDGTGQVSGSITFSGMGSTVGGVKTKLPLTIEVTKDGLEDSLKIFKVEGGTSGTDGTDGSDAVTAFLTNESHTFPADSTGAIASFVGGSTEMEVFEGVTNKTSLYTISSSRGLGVVATDSGNTVTVSALGHDSGSLTITATSASVSLSKTMSLTKARQGADGDDGTSAKLLAGSLESQVFSFLSASDNTSDPSEIIFTFNQQNLNGTIGSGDITISTAGGNVTNFDFDNNDVSSGTGVVSGSISFAGALNSGGLNSTKSNLPVTITATKDGLSDAVKIFKVEGGASGTDGTPGADGVSAVTAFLTNDSHTLPLSSSNTIISLTGASTEIEVFEGTSNKTSLYTVTQNTPSHFTTTLSGNELTITSGSFPHTGSIVLTATSASVSLAKTMSISVARQGDDGTDGQDGSNGVNGTSAKILTITSDSQVFGFDNSVDTTATPSSIVFTVAQQNLAHTIDTGDITITKAGSSTLTTPSLSGTVSGGTGQQTFTVPFSSLTKSDLPLTVSVSNNANNLSDSTKIFKVVGGDTGSDGAAGAAGSDAVTTFLTNEAHTFAAQNNGTIVSFVGATTDMEVFEGVTNSTDNYTFTRTNGTGVSSTISTNTITITAMTHDSGSVDITATSGSTSLTKTMSLVKSKQGTAGLAGADAKSVSLIADSQTFAFDNSVDTTATPSSVNFVVNQQNLSGTIATSDITITKAGGSAFTTPTLGGSVTDGSGTRTFTLPFSSFSKSDLPLSISVSKDSLSDSAKIFKIVGGDTGSDGSAGTDAVTAFLTNESHTFAADFSGSIASFVGGSTDMEVFEGVTNKTSEYTFTRTSTTSVSSSISSNTVTITSMGHDSGSVVVTATKGATSLSKTMSVVKSRQGGVGATGATGAAGTNAKVVSLLANKSVITYNGSDVETPSSQNITLTATDQNHSGTVYYEFLKDGSSQQNSTTATFTINTTAEKPTSTGNVSYVVKTREGGTSGTVIAEDSVSIFGVKSGLDGTAGSDGTSAITAFLTSDGDIVPAASDGTVSSFVGSGTEMIIFQGATDVSSDYTVTRTNSTGLSSTLSTRVLTITALTPDSGSVILTATSASGNVGQVQISKTYSIGKSKQGDTGDTGAAGSNAKTVTVGASSNIFVKAQDGTLSPSSITITANGQNLTANGAFSNTGGTLSSTSVSTSGGSTTVTSGNFSNGMVVTYTAAGADGSITDSVTLNELDEGSGNITAILDNEAHVLPASAAGAVSSYANSGTTIRCFEGATALTFVTGTPGTGEFGVSVGNTANITEGSITDSGTFCTIGNHSGAADGTDQYVITYTISGKTLNGSNFTTFTKTQSLTKSKVGATGPQGNPGANNQDFSFLGASLTGIGPIGSAGLLMTSNVFGFHNGISGTNGALTDFTSFLDSSGNFYLGGNASGASNPTDGYFAWNNTDKSLLISGSKATIDVDKFFVGTKTTQFISGSNGNIEISSSKFHIKPDGDIIVKKVTAEDGTIGGFTLSDTQINSSNNNLILKASGQVTASTLLLTGGTVAGMPVSSDEIAVGEVLKLKQSGQITGSSVLFSGGNIGGFQLENSSLYQNPTALPLLSASFQLKQSFGDYGNVPPFEYSIKFASQNFYIDDLETNCPTEYLGELIKSGSILSSSNFGSAPQGLFQYGTNYQNETKFVVVESFDPKSGFMKLGHNYRLGYYSVFSGGPGTTRVHVVQGVGFNAQYTDGTNDGGASTSNYTAFNKLNETKNLTLDDKVTTKLILSSSAEIKSEIGKIGSFTITGSNVVVTDDVLDREPIYDFRVYVSETLPNAALSAPRADTNNGTPLQLYIGDEFWDISTITNVGENGSTNEGYGYYLAISSSARSSSNLVYDQSQLNGLGMFTGSAAAQSGQNISGWPRGGTSGGSTTLLDHRGFSYIPPTTNRLGQNENWYLKYFDTTTLQSGDTDDFINARVTFLSESITNTFNKFTVFAQTASVVGNYSDRDEHEGALSLQFVSTNASPIGEELPSEGFYAQALLIDGGGSKMSQLATTSSLASSYHSSQFVSFVTNESKANFYESQAIEKGLPVATVDLVTKLTIDGKYIQQIINQTTASSIYAGNSVANYWGRSSSDGITLEELIKESPFLYNPNLANNGITDRDYAALQSAAVTIAGNYTNTNLASQFEEAGNGGFEMVGSASMHFMPYYDIDQFDKQSTGFISGQDGFLPYYGAPEYSFPNFITSAESEGGSNISYTMRNPGSGKHMLVLDKGYILNPLVNLAISNLNKLLPNSPTTGFNGQSTGEGEEQNDTLFTWDKYRIDASGTYNDTSNSRRFGIPFEVSHTYVTGSVSRSTKMILKNAIYPENIAVRGEINAEGLRSRVIEGIEQSINNLLGETGDDTFDITERISDNVVQTNATSELLSVLQSDGGIDGSSEEFFVKLSFAEESKFGEGTIRMGTTSGSLRNSTVLSISSSGEISSSNYIQKPDGQVTGSKINFTGGKISGSDMSIFANEFEFKDDNNNGIIKGNKTTFEISSSLFNLKPTSLDVKGNIQAEQVYGQDTFLAGKVVNTGVINPNSITVKYNLPFVEAYSQDSNDTRLTGSTVESGFIMSGSSTILSQTGSRIQGNHVRFTLSSNLQSTPQFLTPITADGVGYPEEFKSWKDISGVNNDYVFVSNTSARTAADASASLSANLIGNQLVFNEATSSALLFQSSSNSFQSMTTDTINLFDVLKEDRRNVHLQFAVRGTAHPSTGSFNGYNPEYQVQVLDTSGSNVVWEKTYKDTKATHKNWAVFDVPMTDIATFYKQNIEFNKSTGSFDEGTYLGNPQSSGLKVKINMRYSGSRLMSQRITEGTRFGGKNTANESFTLGFALTEMRMVEPVRATSIDTQTVHFKDTYMTWHDNPATTGHYGNFVPEFTSSATTSSFALGAPTEKWESIYLDLKEDNQYPVETLVGDVSQSNKFVRINTHTGKLTFTSASVGSGGGGGSSYSLPTATASTLGGIKVGTNLSISNGVLSATDNDTTYSVGDGGLTQKNFTSTLKTKLDGIATNANNYSFPYTVSAAAGNSTVVQRNSSGYIFGNFLNMTGTFANSGATGTLSFFTGTNGSDNYGRSWTPAQARTALNVADGANVGLPLSGGTMTGAIAMGNQNITGINNLVINDPGPTEGISWNGGNTKIVESPDDLTTNSAGNLQFVFDDTRRMSITSTGADINGNLSLSGDLTASGNQVITAATQADVKFSVWSGTTYGIGMVSAVTLGYLNDYATTFVMNNDADRGWWWGYKDQTKSTGAMSLTTDGRLYVKSSIQAAILSGTGNRMVIANANGELSTQAIPSGGGGGGSSDISMDGSTANGLITYGGTDNIDVETNLTFDGTNLVTSSGPTGGRLRFGDGTYSSPTYAFAGDTDTGMWLGGAADLRFSVGGVTRMQLNANGLRIDDAIGVNVAASSTDGRIDAGNDIVAYSTSDERLKENVKTIDSSLSKVLQIRGVEFDWKELTEEEKKTIHGNEGHDVGVIAQEIEKVLPEVVTERENGYKAVKYEKIVPLLIEAIKEQSDTIEKLTERINKLEKGSNN